MDKIKSIILLSLLFFSFAIYGFVSCHTITEGIVVQKTNTEITIEDETGNLWVWILEPQDNFRTGDRVKMTIFDNETTTKKDDIIQKVEKLSELN